MYSKSLVLIPCSYISADYVSDLLRPPKRLSMLPYNEEHDVSKCYAVHIMLLKHNVVLACMSSFVCEYKNCKSKGMTAVSIVSFARAAMLSR